jgi:predicted NUDIX family NTP pyrophosphohydrolase
VRVTPKRSAGLLLFRRRRDPAPVVEVLIGHMGGPLWAAKDDGGWSIPKGEYDADEAPLAAARREFQEELGLPPPDGAVVDLGEATQRSGKIVRVWAIEGDLDLADFAPGTFTMEWPPGSGRRQEFPEIDAAAWFALAQASDKLIAGQRPFVDRLAEHLRRLYDEPRDAQR